MKEEDIPKEVLESIKRVSENRSIPLEKVMSEYEKIFRSDKIQKWDAPDSEKAKVAGKILFKNFMSKEPVTTYSMLIPVGITEPRLKKDAENKVENMRSTIFAAVKVGDEPFKVKEIVFNGEQAAMVQGIHMIRLYSNVKLYDKGFFIEVGDNTKFDNPQKLKNMSEEDVITRICKFPKLNKLSDVVTHRSRREGGYIDRTDMYLVEGMVQRGFRKGYAIKDESLGYDETIVKVSGEELILPQTLTEWVPSRFYKWDEDSELAFLGTIDIGRDKKPVMNAVLVYPAGFVCELPAGGKKDEQK